MTRRHYILLFLAVAVVLGSSALARYLRERGHIDEATYERIVAGMTVEEVQAIINAAPIELNRNIEGFPVATILDLTHEWDRVRFEHIQPLDVPHFDRREWPGEEWGIAVNFDREGRVAYKSLWRRVQ